MLLSFPPLTLSLGIVGCKSDAWFGTGSNTEASVNTPSGVQTGEVDVIYSLTGEPSDTDIAVSFSVGGSSFREATEGAGGDGTEDLSVSETGDTHTFVWDSGADLDGVRADTVVIRVTPEDGTGDTTGVITVHNGRFLAAVENRAAGRVRLYALDAVEGDLNFLGSADTGGTDPYDVLFDDGFFFVAHRTSNDVAVFELDEVEELITAVEGSPFDGDGVGAKFLATAGDHVFVANTASATITIFNRDEENGVLGLNANSGMGVAGCRALVARSSRLYAASETVGQIVVFDIADDGELLLNGSSPVTAGGLASPSAMVAAGSRLYAANTGSATLCGFNFLGDGDLGAISGSPFTVSSTVVEHLAANGSKLFAVTGAGARLVALTIDSFGAVTEDAASPFTLTGPAFGVTSAGAVVVAGTTTSEVLEVWTIGSTGVVAAAGSSPEDAAVEILRLAVSN